MPYQWIKRYEKVIEAHHKWGLCGILENIHYGFHPSFITDLEKQMFFTNSEEPEKILRDLLIRDYGEENFDTIDKAMHIWSDAITHYVPTNEDQYTAFRVGPSFPLWTIQNSAGWPSSFGKYPSPKHALFGNGIFHNRYIPCYEMDYISLLGFRIHHQIKEFEILRDKLFEGIKVLESIENRSIALQKLINIGWFMYRTTLTVLNLNNMFILMHKLDIVETKEEGKELLARIERILLSEKENVEKTIPLVQFDSRLGWEPSMEYTTDEAALRWKLKQLDIEINHRLPLFKTKATL